jgi:hypothetical protein
MAAYQCFESLVSIENGTECPNLERLRVTALYRLSKSDATAEHRQAALALTERGITVTEKLAASLIRGDDARLAAEPRDRKRVIKTGNGSVEIRVKDGDFKSALEAALAELVTTSKP